MQNFCCVLERYIVLLEKKKLGVPGRGKGPGEEEWDRGEYGRATSRGNLMEREER